MLLTGFSSSASTSRTGEAGGAARAFACRQILLTACGHSGTTSPASDAPASNAPASGAAALAAPVVSLEEVAKLVQNVTGQCADAKRRSHDHLVNGWFIGTTGEICGKHVAEWAHRVAFGNGYAVFSDVGGR
ncbi:hypothetical protein [Lentzea sp. NPDC059081]|uniref:hypothetical protein n=1 Tax=Lentzea sp. NPDC059081 TaxID=3346719 RepID=UPI0036B0891A